MYDESVEIDGFEWDRGNSEKSRKKHGVNDHEIEEVFLNQPLMVFDDSKHSQSEERLIAFGHTNEGRYLTVAYTLRKKEEKILLRPISGRPMHRKEKIIYEEAVSQTEKS